MRIVFHGQNAGAFSGGFAEMMGDGADVVVLPDVLSADERAVFASAEVVIGTYYRADLPRPEGLALFHVPGAGYDSVDLAALPAAAVASRAARVALRFRSMPVSVTGMRRRPVQQEIVRRVSP